MTLSVELVGERPHDLYKGTIFEYYCPETGARCSICVSAIEAVTARIGRAGVRDEATARALGHFTAQERHRKTALV